MENKAPRMRAPKAKAPVIPPSAIVGGGLRFASIAPVAPLETAIEKPKREKRKAEPFDKAQGRKNDPRLVAAARELRDRWMEHANAHPEALLAQGKYDVGRLIDSTMQTGAGGVESASDLPRMLSLDEGRAAA